MQHSTSKMADFTAIEAKGLLTDRRYAVVYIDSKTNPPALFTFGAAGPSLNVPLLGQAVEVSENGTKVNGKVTNVEYNITVNGAIAYETFWVTLG